MSFQSYLTNIRIKTGKTPEDFLRLASEKGFVRDGLLLAGIRARQIIDWLTGEYALGHAQAMAIYAIFKGRK